MLLDDISDYLVGEGTGTVYKDQLPASPDTTLAVFSIPGFGPTHTMQAPHVLEEPRIQVLVRSQSLQTAHQNALNVYGLLNGLRNKTINGVQYHWTTALTQPYSMGRDQNQRYIVACQYDVKKDRST